MPGSRTFLAALLALTPTACLSDGRQAAADSDVSLQAAATGVEAFFRYGPVELGGTRAALAERLGEPDSASVHAVTNPHDPAVTDSIVTVHYQGLSARIYRASFDGRELLASLTLSDDRHLRPESPLRMGMTAEEIRLALGQPAAAEDEDLFYHCDSCGFGGQDRLELRLDRGRLRRIVVQYWID